MCQLDAAVAWVQITYQRRPSLERLASPSCPSHRGWLLTAPRLRDLSCCPHRQPGEKTADSRFSCWIVFGRRWQFVKAQRRRRQRNLGTRPADVMSTDKMDETYRVIVWSRIEDGMRRREPGRARSVTHSDCTRLRPFHVCLFPFLLLPNIFGGWWKG